MMVRKCKEELRQHGKELIRAQRDLVAAQEELINIQRQLLEKREVEITAVQSTAQQEMKSFISVLKDECASALVPKKIQSAIVAASEPQNLRTVGLTSSSMAWKSQQTVAWSLNLKLSLFLLSLKSQNVKSVERLGRQSLTARPVKVVLKSRDAQMSILRNEMRRQLVDRLKEMAQRSPGKHYFIRGKDVVESPGTTEN
eukprot:sb/3470782/